MLARHRALAILTECCGDELWSVEHCRLRGVPEAWIAELADAHESGFRADSQTIYVDNRVINQFHGVRDVDLAVRLAKSMGMDVDRVTMAAASRRAVVQAIKEAVMEGD